MATSHTFPPEETLPHPPINFAKQAVIYNKKGTKCMNIVKEPSPTNQSPISSPPGQDFDALASSHQAQNGIQALNNSSNNYTIELELPNEIDEDLDEFYSDDDGYDPEAPEIPIPHGIWNTNNSEERQRIREFWLQLGEEERRSLLKVEKEMVLKKMKEQQKSPCSCSGCGKKRTAIEEELEILYDAYYEELERYANQQEQQNGLGNSMSSMGSENGSDTRRELFQFGNSLTVKGGILTVADDLLKNDGKKFLEMMETLAEKRMQREEEDNMTDEQRMKESKQMFQIFAAKMFEQRVLNAYKEKVAQERQKKFLEELEEENRLKEEREQKKLKEKEKKNAKKRAQKQQKEEERARKEAERLAEEAALKAERERKAEEERKRREEERLRKEAERRAKEEERLKKEEEKRRKAREEKEREERRRKEQEAKERKEREERERKEREERARREQEAKERKEREERERKERQEKERKIREEKERKEREERERREREERIRKETPIGQPPLQQQQQPQQPPQSQPPSSSSNQIGVQAKAVGQMSNGGAINWMSYPTHEAPQQLPVNQPPPPPHLPPSHQPPHHLFGTAGAPQPPPFGTQGLSGLNGHTSIPNDIINDIYTNNKKIINTPPLPPQPQTNTIPGINPQSSLFATGLGPIGMVPQQHHGPPVIHPHHQQMRQNIPPPPRGYNPITANPHLPVPPPSSVTSSNLSILNDSVIGGGNTGGGSANINAGVPSTLGSNQPTGFGGGLPLGGGGQGPLGTQTFNLGTQVIGQPSTNNVPNSPLPPIGHSRRLSTHHDDSHVIQPPNSANSKTIQRPAPIQRPRRGSASNASQPMEMRTRSPPPGFGVGSSVLRGDEVPLSMASRRQSLATPLETATSYFSNSLFSTLPGG
ncbi:5473_t:CDS:10 [Ambispora gerdemannii]|uniref:Stress response protein NST1 n=1 Tax=Ambispora gerdemannii TaxID=144530 RepID=A0A9N9F0D2_9GLOM|nr:5473_t:CDS:10 [Ambispora gerdemannii]